MWGCRAGVPGVGSWYGREKSTLRAGRRGKSVRGGKDLASRRGERVMVVMGVEMRSALVGRESCWRLPIRQA